MRSQRRMTARAFGGTALALGLLLSGCSANGGLDDAEAPDADVLANAEEEVKVSFWHSMDGTNGETLEKLVADFNSKNTGEVVIEPVFQGNYDDAITKYKAAVQSNSTPSLVQIYDIGGQFMLDSQTVSPIQAFVDRDEYDTSDLQPNIAGYYSVDDKLLSMPFNTSMPVLYYNKTLFEAAGLDPEVAPLTLDEVGAAAEKLSKKNGGPAEFGFNAAVYGWFVEQEIASNGDLYCSPDNGRGDEKATEFTFDNAGAVEFLTWWSALVDSGVAGNTGRDTGDAQSAFKSGTIGISLESTGALGGMQAAAQEQNFELGVGYFPRIEANDFGPIIGGASLYIAGEGHTDEEQEGAWQFIKFVNEPANQAIWHTGTGYFPVSKAALNEPLDVEWREKYPQFDVAVKQLEETQLSIPTTGCRAGVMPQARQAVETALEAVLQGGDPQTELTKAAEGLQQQLDEYNASVDG